MHHTMFLCTVRVKQAQNSHLLWMDCIMPPGNHETQRGAKETKEKKGIDSKRKEEKKKKQDHLTPASAPAGPLQCATATYST